MVLNSELNRTMYKHLSTKKSAVVRNRPVKNVTSQRTSEVTH